MPNHLRVLRATFAVCRLRPDADVPPWATGAVVSVTRTADELSVLCAEADVPAAVRCERGWRGLRVVGQLDFALVGVLAALVVPLAEAGVSVFALSTFDTDYLFVRAADLGRARAALTAAGHRIEEE